MLRNEHRSLVTSLLLVVLLLSACQPVQPLPAAQDDLRQVSGAIYLPSVPEWGGVAVSFDMDFQEVNPETHEATDYLNWRNFQPQPPAGEPNWKTVNSDVRYLFFGADEEGGDPNVVVVITQIRSKDGWGQGEPGEYAYFWFRDGGKNAKDQWGMRYFSFDPWYEFYPAGEPPVEAGYFTLEEMQADDPVLPLTVEVGDFAITAGAATAMPGEAATKAVIDDFYAAYEAFDVAKLLSLHTDDAVWTWADPGKNFPDFGPEGKSVGIGHETIQAMFEADRGELGFTGYPLWSEVDGNVVRAIELWQNDYGRAIDVPIVTQSVYTLRDGKIADWVWTVSPASSERFMQAMMAAAALESAPATTEIRSAIAATNDEFMATFAAGDAAGMSEFYTADGQLLPPNGDFVTGKAAIADFWQSLFDTGVSRADLDIAEVEVRGDIAYEVSAYTLYTANGQIADQGKYIVIWKQDGGEWKLHRDIFNTSLSD
jgi:uncharacterized protein (TIGR02246 family)